MQKRSWVGSGTRTSGAEAKAWLFPMSGVGIPKVMARGRMSEDLVAVTKWSILQNTPDSQSSYCHSDTFGVKTRRMEFRNVTSTQLYNKNCYESTVGYHVFWLDTAAIISGKDAYEGPKCRPQHHRPCFFSCDDWVLNQRAAPTFVTGRGNRDCSHAANTAGEGNEHSLETRDRKNKAALTRWM